MSITTPQQQSTKATIKAYANKFLALSYVDENMKDLAQKHLNDSIEILVSKFLYAQDEAIKIYVEQMLKLFLSEIKTTRKGNNKSTLTEILIPITGMTSAIENINKFASNHAAVNAEFPKSMVDTVKEHPILYESFCLYKSQIDNGLEKHDDLNPIAKKYYGIFLKEAEKRKIKIKPIKVREANEKWRDLYNKLQTKVGPQTLNVFDLRFGLLGDILSHSHPFLKAYDIKSPSSTDILVLRRMLDTPYSSEIIKFLNEQRFNDSRRNTNNKIISDYLKPGDVIISEEQAPRYFIKLPRDEIAALDNNNDENLIQEKELYNQLKSVLNSEFLYLFAKRFGLLCKVEPYSNLQIQTYSGERSQKMDKSILSNALNTPYRAAVISFIKNNNKYSPRRKKSLLLIIGTSGNQFLSDIVDNQLKNTISKEEYKVFCDFLNKKIQQDDSIPTLILKKVFLNPNIREYYMYQLTSIHCEEILVQIRSIYAQSEIAIKQDDIILQYQSIFEAVAASEYVKYLKILILIFFEKIDLDLVLLATKSTKEELESESFKQIAHKFAAFINQNYATVHNEEHAINKGVFTYQMIGDII